MVKKAAQATPNRLLRAARKERGWTQRQVADRIGAPSRSIPVAGKTAQRSPVPTTLSDSVSSSAKASASWG
jgi:transcriptional regulator with XRE-family HTH domain